MNPSAATPAHQTASPKPLPLAGLRVVEFTHMVMGPTCGMVLADMGAEVIKVEPIGHGREGDATRQLLGSGSGFFPMFNRNKKSIAIDLHKPEGAEVARRPTLPSPIRASSIELPPMSQTTPLASGQPSSTPWADRRASSSPSTTQIFRPVCSRTSF